MRNKLTFTDVLLILVAILPTQMIVAQNWDTKGNSNALDGSKLGTINNYPLTLVTSDKTRMQIDAGGNIGIGTATPTQMLDVNGRGLFRSLVVSNNGSIPAMRQIFTGGNARQYMQHQPQLMVYGSGVGFYAEVTERDATGILSIGGSEGVTGHGNNVGIAGYGKNGGVYAYGENYGVLAIGEKIGVDASGKEAVVGKGRENGVHGYGRMIGVCGNGSEDGWGGYFVSEKGSGLYAATLKSDKNYAAVFNGNILVNNVLNPSDRRFKKNIMPVDNALSLVRRLQPKQFEFRINENGDSSFYLPDGRHYGFIAQEVEQFLPSLVKENDLRTYGMMNAKAEEQTSYKSVNYIEFIPLLTKAIQEQQAIIEKQQEKIADLLKRLEALEKKLIIK